MNKISEDHLNYMEKPDTRGRIWQVLAISGLLMQTACGGGTESDPNGCSVEEIENGAIITCDDGSTAVITNGNDGEDGADGVQGEQGETGEIGPTGPQGPDGTDGEDGDSCQTPTSTYNMRTYRIIAEDEFTHRLAQTEEYYGEACPDNGFGNTSEECRLNYLQSRYSAYHGYAERSNLFPQHECSAEIMTITSTMDEYVTEEGRIAVWTPNMEDTDGDGISNYHEHFMGLNPCTQQSFGCQNDADGDFDYDGIPNGEDDAETYWPFCPADVSYWPAECI